MTHSPIQPTHDAEELFENSFYEWLEASGVDLSSMLVGDKFVAHLDINRLKSAILAREQTIKDQAAIEARIDENNFWIGNYRTTLDSLRPGDTYVKRSMRITIDLFEERKDGLKQQKESL